MAGGDLKLFLGNIPQRDKPKLLILVVALLALLLSVFVCNCIVKPAAYAGKIGASKKNIHAIQLIVERFAVDTEGTYPLHVADAINRDYADHLPLNPFTGQPMRELRLGDPPSLGDFYYVPSGPSAAQYSSSGAAGPIELDYYSLVLCLDVEHPPSLYVPEGNVTP